MSNAAQLAVGAYLPGRNRIMNGSGLVAIRAAVAYATTAGTIVSGFSGPDRYKVINNAGGSITQSQGSMTYAGTPSNSILQTATAANTNITTAGNLWTGISQAIEGYEVYDLVNQVSCLSFVFSASVAGTYSVALRDSTPGYSFVYNVTVAANTPTRFVIPVPPAPLAASIPVWSGSGMYFSIGAVASASLTCSAGQLGSWSAGNFICGAGFTNWGATVGATIAVSQLKLEQGPIATPYDAGDFELEQIRCQRYAQLLVSDGGGVAAAAGNTYLFPQKFTQMRAIPTYTAVSSGSASNCGASLAPSGDRSAYWSLTASAAGTFFAVGFVGLLNAEL